MTNLFHPRGLPEGEAQWSGGKHIRQNFKILGLIPSKGAVLCP